MLFCKRKCAAGDFVYKSTHVIAKKIAAGGIFYEGVRIFLERMKSCQGNPEMIHILVNNRQSFFAKSLNLFSTMSQNPKKTPYDIFEQSIQIENTKIK